MRIRDGLNSESSKDISELKSNRVLSAGPKSGLMFQQKSEIIFK